MEHNIFLSLGSNQGDPAANLLKAAKHIQRTATIVGQSSFYRTAAWGMEQQPDFYNQVLHIQSFLSPESLLATILDIEQQIGRVRLERWGPRIIDIDLLLYDDRIIDTPALKVPHPRIPERRFVLTPLAEIASGFVHPVLKKKIGTLLEECTDPLSVEKL